MTCKNCKSSFNQRHKKQLYCSTACKSKNSNSKVYKYTYGLANGTTGAIQELVVSIDLMKKGYEVFRALSPSCSHDLIATKDKQCLRLEVRTGYLMPNNKLYYPKNIKTRIQADRYAIVVGGEVIYEPSL